ncbi:MAG: helix-turn-helix domain-containing protein [Methanomicrobiales archaeon]|nr:helix-turn-helix domain-containing protein [Methanomicrobiales archaeon]
MVEGVVILEPGDERAKKIAKAMASGTATGILNLLKGEKRTSTQVAGELQIPITTVQYHLENLLDAGLIEVAERRWSVKGREVKVYGLRDQLLIVVPKRGDLKGLLLKYTSLFTLVMFAGIMAAILSPMLGIGAVPGIGPEEVSGAGEQFVRVTSDKLSEGVASPAVSPQATAPAGGLPVAAPGFNWIPLLVFFGGVVVVLVLMGNETLRWYRER